MSIRLISSRASTVISAAALSSIATFGAMNLAGTAEAQAPPRTTEVLVQPLSELQGREVRITLLDRPPGDASPPHHHPGHYTFGYVIEGTYQLGINGGPTRVLKAGDAFYEPPDAIHSVSRNASTDKNLKIVVFMVADSRNPSTVTEK